MPYLSKEDQRILMEEKDVPTTPGELNFLVTMLCKEYLGETPRYQNYNDVIGALEACKLELYARLVRPYEEKKITENGDVYL